MLSETIQRRLSRVLLIASVLATGCSSPHFRGRDMPAEFRAAPGAGKQSIQLNGLSTLGAGSAMIGPADLLEVRIITGFEEDQTLPTQVRVDELGRVDVPIIGLVQVAGNEPAQAAAVIAAAAVERGVYVRPQVELVVQEHATHRVTVLGAVNEPGVQEVPRSACDILGAIAAAGGFNEEAGAVVEVLRHESGYPRQSIGQSTPGENQKLPNDIDGAIQQVSFNPPAPSSIAGESEKIDLSDPVSRAQASQYLSDRDVVIVRPREKRVVHVSGLVREPNQYELPEDHDLRVLDAVAMAGGVTSNVADKAIVIRRAEGQEEPIVVHVSLSHAKADGSENLLLRSGDLVSVEPTIATTVVETFTDLFRITMGVGGNLTLF